MWNVSVFGKEDEGLVAEYRVEEADWCLLRGLLKIDDDIPIGEYPLNEWQLKRLSGLLVDYTSENVGSYSYFLGYVAP